MKKLTLAGLRKLRASLRQAGAAGAAGGGDTQVVVGMGTCGVAAGAQKTFDAIRDALAARHVTNVVMRQTGCMGLCHSEPTVEVLAPDMPAIIYGNVTAAVGREIVEQHVIGRRLVDDRICDKPAMDIMR